MKVSWLSAQRTGRLYPSRKYLSYLFLSDVQSSQGHSAAVRIIASKNPNDPTGNRNRAGHQPTAPRRTQTNMVVVNTKRAVPFSVTTLLNQGQSKVEFVVHKVAL